MKKIVVLFLCVLLLVAILTGCGGEKRFELGLGQGGYTYGFYHSLGNLKKLDVGAYDIILYQHIYTDSSTVEEIKQPALLLVVGSSNDYGKNYYIRKYDEKYEYTTFGSNITEYIFE